MIRVGNNNPHAYYETSHISTPQKTYAYETRKRELPPTSMRKVSAVYVGDKHVYPELFRYTLKYRNRVSFTFHGNSHGFMRPSSHYAEAITTGYVEDTVRIDTVFPLYIGMVPLTAPEDYYSPHSASHEKYSKPPWGIAEQYRNFSGTEYLITPACGLLCRVPYTKESIYNKYIDGGSSSVAASTKMAFRIILERVVSSSTTHPVMRAWDYDPESYSTYYAIKARQTFYPYSAPDSIGNGYYANTGNIASAIKLDKERYVYLSMGFVFRPAGSPGGEGAYLFTDMDHLYGSNSILLGASSPTIYGYEVPGRLTSSYGKCYTVKAPMFSGHKHIDNYDSGWNVGRQEITSWEDPQMDSWAHTDLDGSVSILENNNPMFGSVAEYVRSYYR